MDEISSDRPRPTHSIRPFNLDDADWITEACQDPAIARWTEVPSPYRRDHAVEFIEQVPPDVREWAIYDSEGAPVGAIGARDLETTTAVIGYWVAPWGRGRGAARNALKLVLDEISDLDHIKAARAYIADGNVASQAVVRSAGFALVGDADRNCPDGDSEAPALLFERPLARP